MGDSMSKVGLNGSMDVLKILDEINEGAKQREDLKKRPVTPSTYQLPPLVSNTVPVQESTRAVDGVPPSQKGHKPYDSMEVADPELYEIQELYNIPLTPRTQHHSQGIAVREVTGTSSALLVTPAEVLTMFLTMPQWVKSFCKINDTRKCEAITRDETGKTDGELAASAVKKTKKKGKARKMMRWITMVAQVAQTFFAAIGEYVAKGLNFAHDRGVLLLARAAKSCMNVCEKMHETYTAASQDKADPIAWITSGYKQLTAWMKALFN